MDFDTAFPGDGIIVLAPIPVVFTVDYSGILPQNSLQEIQDDLTSPKPLIFVTGGKAQKGINAAIIALTLNDFCSYFFTEHTFGVLKGSLTTNFMKEMRDNLQTNMCIKKIYRWTSPNAHAHINKYNMILQQSFQIRQQTERERYKKLFPNTLLTPPPPGLARPGPAHCSTQ